MNQTHLYLARTIQQSFPSDARLFDGSNDFLSTTTLPSTATDNFTVGGWVYRSAGGELAILDWGVTTPNLVLFTSGGDVRVRFNRLSDGAGSELRSTNTSLLTLNTWCFVVAKRVSGTWKINVNGVDQAYAFWLSGVDQSSSTCTDAPGAYTGNFEVGTFSATRYWNGRIAHVAVWETAIADADLLDLYTNLKTPSSYPSSLVAYWPIAGSTSPEPNTISGNTLTVNGTIKATGPGLEYVAPAGAALTGAITASATTSATFSTNIRFTGALTGAGTTNSPPLSTAITLTAAISASGVTNTPELGDYSTNPWTYAETWEGFTLGALNGQDSWVADAGFVISSAQAEGGSSKSLALSGGAAAASRQFAGVTSGEMSFHFYRTPDNGVIYVSLLEGGSGTQRLFVRFSNNGTMYGYDSASDYIEIAPYGANTWNEISFQWDNALHPNQFRVRIFDGTTTSAWSSWLSAYGGGSYSSIGGFRIDTDGMSGTAYFDSIGPVGGAPAVAAELAGDLAASATVAAALSTSIPLTGAITASATTSASLSTSINLTAAVSASAITNSPALSTNIRFAGALSASATTAASLSTSIPLTGALSSTAVLGTAALSTSIRFAAAVSSSAAAAGTFSTNIRFTGALSSAAVTNTPALSTAIALTGALTSSATIAGTMAELEQITGAVVCSSSAAATTLSTSIRFAGALSSGATTTASLSTSIPLSGALAASAQTSGTFTTTIRFAGALSASATTVATFSTDIRFTGSATGSSVTNTPTLSTAIRFTGALSASGIVDGNLLGGAAAFTGALTAGASATATLSTSIPLTGALAASGAVSNPALSTAIRFTGALSAAATTSTASLSTSIRFTGAINHTSTVSGVLSTAIPLTGALASSTIVSGQLATSIPFTGSIASSAQSTAALTTAIVLTGNLSSAAILGAATLDTAISLEGSLSATATLDLIGFAPIGYTEIDGVIVCSSSVTGTLYDFGIIGEDIRRIDRLPAESRVAGLANTGSRTAVLDTPVRIARARRHS